ncbi:MAG TPA: hypothetical protein VJI68_01405 [Candidatus Nanoarchaeia archaeon]|nr:hypothetical protein [Candidatus Nanoarchaeia archaeon]
MERPNLALVALALAACSPESTENNTSAKDISNLAQERGNNFTPKSVVVVNYLRGVNINYLVGNAGYEVAVNYTLREGDSLCNLGEKNTVYFVPRNTKQRYVLTDSVLPGNQPTPQECYVAGNIPRNIRRIPKGKPSMVATGKTTRI